MRKLLKYFPLSLSTTDGKSLAITILIYVAVPAVFALISSLFSKVLLLGTVLTLISACFIFYCFIGVILAVLKVANVIR